MTSGSSDPRRDLPSVDRLVTHERLQAARARWSPRTITAVARRELDRQRKAPAPNADLDRLAAACAGFLDRLGSGPLQRVVNATGVVIHTNLGRAPLDHAIDDLIAAASGYDTLEFDRETGGRGDRQAHLAPYCELLFPDHRVLAVNNNAAALLLALHTLAQGREVLISRGELVEIGGSFRVPEILACAGTTLRELGTTNRTHLRDYEAALGAETALILKVWPSNYRVIGFTQEVPVAALAQLARRTALPLLVDQGCGRLLRDSPGSVEEPSVEQLLDDGADLVCCSGDKLLGGPQAGLLIGRAEVIARCARSPLMRALRPDKLTLAALAATLRTLLSASANTVVGPMLGRDPRALDAAARQLAELVRGACPQAEVTVLAGSSRAGGGAAPELELPTSLVGVRFPGVSADRLMQQLRAARPPVVARVIDEQVCFDPRTLLAGDDEAIVSALQPE